MAFSLAIYDALLQILFPLLLCLPPPLLASAQRSTLKASEVCLLRAANSTIHSYIGMCQELFPAQREKQSANLACILQRRSGCPLNASVEMLGDRWSLLVIRDMMIRGYRTFNEFMQSDEKIATNILAARLRRLEAYGIISAERDPSDGRKSIYALTVKGIALAPVLTEMVLWAAKHKETGNPALVRRMRTGKDQLLAGVRKRWAEQQHGALNSELSP
jgi:DNA-binding HxlR family transcriptional regulator